MTEDDDDGIDVVGGWDEPGPVTPASPAPVARKLRRVGVDIGQQGDPTAISVIEPTWNAETKEAIFHLRDIRRLPLRTSYPEVGRYLARVVRGLSVRINGPVDIFLDATGVGRGPLDILREELVGVQHRLYGVTITSGASLRERDGGSVGPSGRRLLRSSRELMVGKEHLVSRLNALLQTGRLRTPPTGRDRARDEELAAMRRELIGFEIRAREGGHDQSGAFATGTHDDLVVCLALGCLLEHRGDGDTTGDALQGLNRKLRDMGGPTGGHHERRDLGSNLRDPGGLRP